MTPVAPAHTVSALSSQFTELVVTLKSISVILFVILTPTWESPSPEDALLSAPDFLLFCRVSFLPARVSSVHL